MESFILMSAISVLGSRPTTSASIVFSVGELNFDFVRLGHHVVVGYDIAFGVDDKPGSHASLFIFLGHLIAEKFLEKILKPVLVLFPEAAAEWHGLTLDLPDGGDIHHGRPHPFSQGRKSRRRR